MKGVHYKKFKNQRWKNPSLINENFVFDLGMEFFRLKENFISSKSSRSETEKL